LAEIGEAREPLADIAIGAVSRHGQRLDHIKKSLLARARLGSAQASAIAQDEHRTGSWYQALLGQRDIISEDDLSSVLNAQSKVIREVLANSPSIEQWVEVWNGLLKGHQTHEFCRLETGVHADRLSLFVVIKRESAGGEANSLIAEIAEIADAARLALHEAGERFLLEPTEVVVAFQLEEAISTFGVSFAKADREWEWFAEGRKEVSNPFWQSFADDLCLNATNGGPKRTTVLFHPPPSDAASDDQNRMDRALDQWLQLNSLGQRPVEAARVSAIVPLQCVESYQGQFVGLYQHLRHQMLSSVAQASEYQNPGKTLHLEGGSNQSGQHYFLPHVQKLLCPTPNDLRLALARLQKPPGSIAIKSDSSSVLDEHIFTIVRDLSDKAVTMRVWRLNRRKPIDARLVDVRLHFYCERMAALEWTVEFTDPDKPSANQTVSERDQADLAKSYRRVAPRKDALDDPIAYWRRLVWRDVMPDGSEGRAPVTVAEVLDHTHIQRLIYSTHVAEESETDRPAAIEILDENGAVLARTDLFGRKVDASPGERKLPIVGVFRHMLASILGDHLEEALNKARQTKEGQAQTNPGLEELFEIRSDERARLVTSLVPAGEKPGKHGNAALEWAQLEARLHMAEAYGQGWPYPQEFSEGEMRAGLYGRYREWGTSYLVSDHVFAALSFSDFGLNPIHRAHVPFLYRRMALLLYLNTAVLNAFSRGISTALEGWNADDQHDESDDRFRAAYGKLEPSFLKFTNLNWFEQVTAQIQGIELFELMRKQSRAGQEYQLIAAEIARTDRLLARLATEEVQRQDRARTRMRDWLTQMAALIGGIGISAAIINDDALPTVVAFANRFAEWVGLTVTPGMPEAFKLPVQEWRFQLAALATSVLVMALMGFGQIQMPGANREKFAIHKGLVAFAHILTFALPWLVIVHGREWLTGSGSVLAGGALSLIVAWVWWGARPMPRAVEASLLTANEQNVASLLSMWRLRFWSGLGSWMLYSELERWPDATRADKDDFRALRANWVLLALGAALFVFVTVLHAGGVLDVPRVLAGLVTE
jgi:hypothetical protein